MTRFRRGDGRSRAASWAARTAGSLQRHAEKLGLVASAPHGSAWGSHYLDVWSPEQDEHLHIRVANHAHQGGTEHVDISVHNEIDGAASAADAKAAIAEFARKHGAVPAAKTDRWLVIETMSGERFEHAGSQRAAKAAAKERWPNVKDLFLKITRA